VITQTFCLSKVDRYRNGGNADVIIDLGDGIAVFEIVSHRLTVPTRISGRRTSFDSDMEARVFKKVRQLNDTVRSLVDEIPND
jgi:hypothetical protein